ATRTDNRKLGGPAATPHPKPNGGRAGGAPTIDTEQGRGFRLGVAARLPHDRHERTNPSAAVRRKLRDPAGIEFRQCPIPYTMLNRPSGNCSTLRSSIACRAADENNALPFPAISG